MFGWMQLLGLAPWTQDATDPAGWGQTTSKRKKNANPWAQTSSVNSLANNYLNPSTTFNPMSMPDNYMSWAGGRGNWNDPNTIWMPNE